MVRGVNGVWALGGVIREGVVPALIIHKVGHNIGDRKAQCTGQVQGDDICLSLQIADVDTLVCRVVLTSQLGPQANSALIEEPPEVGISMEISLDRVSVVRTRHILYRRPAEPLIPSHQGGERVGQTLALELPLIDESDCIEHVDMVIVTPTPAHSPSLGLRNSGHSCLR